MKKHIWRPGDRCRIIKPLWVKRVGYPLIWYDLMDEVENDPKVGQAWAVLHGQTLERTVAFLASGFSTGPTDGVPRYFLQAAAKALVEQRGFGGNERKIIYDDEGRRGFQCQPGSVLEVFSRRVVKTGTRFAETGGVKYTWDGPEDWYEPGGLAHIQTHILLMTGCGEIEAANVELVDKIQEV